MAARLAENGWLVLLLEAGGAPTAENFIPGLSPAPALVKQYGLDWGTYIVPQKHAMFGYKNNVRKRYFLKVHLVKNIIG